MKAYLISPGIHFKAVKPQASFTVLPLCLLLVSLGIQSDDEF